MSAQSRSRSLGLRVDVDTHDGMCLGVPRLLDVLMRHQMHASFFFSMGPDNAGRAVFNLLRPGFLAKMRRTSATRVYGWRTVLSGTLLPARMIGNAFPELIARTAAEGHEVGVHAWNHRLWQDRLPTLAPDTVASELDRGRTAFASAVGAPPRCFAAPAWLTCDAAVAHQESFGLDYASDCRGTEPFLPLIDGPLVQTPQVPTTLPTLDEALGVTHTTGAEFFAEILRATVQQAWPVLTIHAELEGGPYEEAFDRFLSDLSAYQSRAVTLGNLLSERKALGPLARCRLGLGTVGGRHGQVVVQVPS